MKNNFYLFISAVITVTYWIIETAAHDYFFDGVLLEIIPDDANELWMRSSISLLLLSFGLFADHHSLKIQEKEQDKLRAYQATVAASNHILNNYLQQMLLFKLESMKCEDFSSEMLELFDQTMNEATTELRKLNSLTEVNEGAIRKAVYPQ